MQFITQKRKTGLLTKSTTMFTILVLLLLGLVFASYITRKRSPESVSVDKNGQGDAKVEQQQSKPDLKPKTIIKEALLLEVPFTSQAPTGNWDELHNDACEEASAIMVAEYFSGNRSQELTASFVESEIEKLTEWQQQNYGYYLSITTEETAKMIESVYGLRTSIAFEFTENKIKEALNKNQLVILPANGRLLGNPNFKQPGPIYHMVVIIGYDEQGFITNDPGTRRGKHYRYDFDTLYEAAAEWNHGLHTTNTDIKPLLIISNRG